MYRAITAWLKSTKYLNLHIHHYFQVLLDTLMLHYIKIFILVLNRLQQHPTCLAGTFFHPDFLPTTMPVKLDFFFQIAVIEKALFQR
jgi:hypothetical protein